MPTPHGGALKWKEAYFEIALSLWKPLNAQRSTKPASVDEFIFNYKTSEKLYRDKGKGKFTSKMNWKCKYSTKVQVHNLKISFLLQLN